MSRRPPADRARDWYEANARRYDRRHPGLPGDAAFYAALARGVHTLEVGAGTGRITAALAKTATRVAALDYSPAMLAIAARRLQPAPNVDLICADARALPVCGPFSLAILAGRVLQHLGASERQRLLIALGAMLPPGGTLAFDTWHGPHAPPGRRSAADVSLTPMRVEDVPRELVAAGFGVTRGEHGFGGDADPTSFVRVWIATRGV